MMKQMKILMVVLVTMVLFLASTSTAFAQNNDADDEAVVAGLSAGILTTTSGVTTAAALPVGIIITVVLVASSDDKAELENYMRDNAVALHHDLTMGGGDSIRDLAVFFNVPDEEFSEFAAILHQNRSQLSPLLVPNAINNESAHEFSAIVVGEMMNHEGLRARLVEQAG